MMIRGAAMVCRTTQSHTVQLGITRAEPDLHTRLFDPGRAYDRRKGLLEDILSRERSWNRFIAKRRIAARRIALNR
jgi:hypothetical protein